MESPSLLFPKLALPIARLAQCLLPWALPVVLEHTKAIPLLGHLHLLLSLPGMFLPLLRITDSLLFFSLAHHLLRGRPSQSDLSDLPGIPDDTTWHLELSGITLAMHLFLCVLPALPPLGVKL